MTTEGKAREDAVLHAPHPPLEAYYLGEAGRLRFVRSMFDSTAGDYERVERMLSFGTGARYRRQALIRAGLARGMEVLDIAVGTGLVAREAATVVGALGKVYGVDPSPGMLERARKTLGMRALLGLAEQIPCVSDRFDFVSMGFALRHISDLELALREFHRTLRPGGRLCMLEITRPAGRFARTLLRAYMRGLGPILTRIVTGHADTALLWRYYWDTIESCVAPERVLHALEGAGFEDVSRHVELGLFSEYCGRKPARRQ